MRAATEGSLPPVMPQGNLVEVLGREVRQGSPGELMVESSPSRQRRPPCKTNKEMSDEAADAAALTYLLTNTDSESSLPLLNLFPVTRSKAKSTLPPQQKEQGNFLPLCGLDEDVQGGQVLWVCIPQVERGQALRL